MKLPKINLQNIGYMLLAVWTVFVLAVLLFPFYLLFSFIIFGINHQEELIIRGVLSIAVSFLLVPLTMFIYEEFV